MQAAVPLFERHFFQAFHRTFSTHSSTQQFLNPRTHTFCTQEYEQEVSNCSKTIDVSQSTREDYEDEPKSLCGRIEKLARGDPVGFAFQSWMGDGFPVHRGDIFHTINRLRKRKFNKRALQVMEWVIRERPYMPKQLDYSYLLEFTAKLHGISQVEAFGKTGDVSRAEDLWTEMKSKEELKSIDQFNSLISVYCRHGFITKATGLYKEMEKHGCKANSITFRHLAVGCLKSGLKNEALKTLELGMDLTTSTSVKKSTPWLETTYSLVDLFAENGDVENAETLFDELKKANYAKYTFVYNALIMGYVKAKIYDPNLLKRMILGGSRADSETYSLLKVLEHFRD